MADITIERQTATGGGRYVATIAGMPGEAELIYTIGGPKLIRADHAEAPPVMRGTGVAAALVTRLVDDARASGMKVQPRCSYVAWLFDRNPQWNDLRHR